MPRIARIVVPGVAHHVTQRGNNRQDVFFTDVDRLLYLTLLKQESVKQGVRVLAYCLMTNHVHLVLVPERAESLALAVGARTGCTRSRSIACTADWGICGKTDSSHVPWMAITSCMLCGMRSAIQ